MRDSLMSITRIAPIPKKSKVIMKKKRQYSIDGGKEKDDSDSVDGKESIKQYKNADVDLLDRFRW